MTLRKFKTAIFWSLFSKELTVDEIPDCFKNLILKAQDLVI